MDHSCIGKYLFLLCCCFFFFIKTVLSLDIIKHCHQPCLRMSKTNHGLMLLLSIINPSCVLWTTFPLKVNADGLPHERKQFCLLLFVHVLILSARRAKVKKKKKNILVTSNITVYARTSEGKVRMIHSICDLTASP